MKKPQDFAMENVHQLFCSHCTDKEGKLLPYKAVLEGTINFFMQSQGIAKEAAVKMSKDLLSSMPAWKGKDLTQF
ncbi:MAG: hypothetical protein H0U73_01180 [Tatlockia sp.]|nr:hypothetical protein [Tatlockia sp.]